MKKIICGILFVIVIILVSKPRYNLSGDMVRFRVIANSNSSIDILIKEKVVNELSTLLFKDSNDINETRNNVVNNLEQVNSSIIHFGKSIRCFYRGRIQQLLLCFRKAGRITRYLIQFRS